MVERDPPGFIGCYAKIQDPIMDEGAHAPGTSRSSPTVQNPRESEDERQPLLGSGNASLKGLQTGQSMQDSRFDVVTRMKHWNWRNLIVLTALWLAYGVVNCASSIMGPFFPNEVSWKFTNFPQMFSIMLASISCRPWPRVHHPQPLGSLWVLHLLP